MKPPESPAKGVAGPPARNTGPEAGLRPAGPAVAPGPAGPQSLAAGRSQVLPGVQLFERRVQTLQHTTSHMAILDAEGRGRTLTTDTTAVVFGRQYDVGPPGGGTARQRRAVATPALVIGALLGMGTALTAAMLALPAICVCLAYAVPVCAGILITMRQYRRHNARARGRPGPQSGR